MVQEHQELTKQNWGFISPEEQAQIARTRVLLVGCGLGSNIAVLAARTGFCRFTIADGDAVETSNLNRQAFRMEHVGQSKAHATTSLIKEVNPQAHVQAVPAFVEARDADSLVQQSDLVVNMVDPGPALHALLNAATTQDKITLFPMNIAYGGMVLAFGPQSPSLEELMGPGPDNGLFLRIIQKLMPSLPSYLWKFAPVAQRIQLEGVPPPQLGLAASITASLVVESMVKIATGYQPPLVPNVITLDSRNPALLTWPIAHNGK